MKIAQSKTVGLALVLMAFASACAFKQSPGDQALEIAHRLDGRILGASIQWEGQNTPIAFAEGDLSKTGAHSWKRDQVITLPVGAPQSTTVVVLVATAPQDVKSLTSSAIATTGDDLNERSLGGVITGSTPADFGTSVKIQLVGADTLFQPDREQRMYVTVKLLSGQSEFASVRFVMSTPPSRLTAVKQELVYGQAAVADLNPALLTLTSQAETRELIERIRLRNDSFEKVRLTIPFKNHGTVRLRDTKFSADPSANSNVHVAAYVQNQEDENWDIESDFYVFPLSDVLPTAWTSFSQTDMDSLVLVPGASIDLGLYADVSALKTIESHPASVALHQTLPTSSMARCPWPRPIPQEEWCDLFDGSHDGVGWHYPPDAIDLCKQDIRAMNACQWAGWPVATCNQAALLDDAMDARRMTSNGVGPWPLWLSCMKLITTPDGQHTVDKQVGWQWWPVNQDFKTGVDMAPVTIDWSNGEIPFISRFAPNGASEDTESRSLTLIPKSFGLRK